MVTNLHSTSIRVANILHCRRELGGELPPYIEVRCPAMESRVKIDIPSSVSLETKEGLAMFTRENIIGLVRDALKNFKDWEFIIEREVEKGKHIELAWRMETKLDWIWLDDDVNGNKREFAVLCGLPLKQVGWISISSLNACSLPQLL